MDTRAGGSELTAADHLRICEAKRGGATEQTRSTNTLTPPRICGAFSLPVSRPRPVRRLYPHFSAYPGAHPLLTWGKNRDKGGSPPRTPPSSGGEQAHKGQKWIVRDNPTLRASPPAAPMATASQLPLSATAPAAAPRATKAKYQLASF